MGCEMTVYKDTVIRDEMGLVINIGDWNYMVSRDDDGNEVINNPLPNNVTISNEDVIINEDGSRSVYANLE